ncbi:putative membrane protein [Streptococcus downei F0415]|nr:putative membrane protein [Streptococcus downei F0415]
MAHQLLTKLVDWEKILKVNLSNLRQVNLLVMFLAIGLGYLVSSFFLSIISLATSIFTTVH